MRAEAKQEGDPSLPAVNKRASGGGEHLHMVQRV